MRKLSMRLFVPSPGSLMLATLSRRERVNYQIPDTTSVLKKIVPPVTAVTDGSPRRR